VNPGLRVHVPEELRYRNLLSGDEKATGLDLLYWTNRLIITRTQYTISCTRLTPDHRGQWAVESVRRSRHSGSRGALPTMTARIYLTPHGFSNGDASDTFEEFSPDSVSAIYVVGG